MKIKKISLAEIKNVLNRDEMKKLIGGCGGKCSMQCYYQQYFNPCSDYQGCGPCWSAFGYNTTGICGSNPAG